jgi:long-chain acyl-CoA synthetase
MATSRNIPQEPIGAMLRASATAFPNRPALVSPAGEALTLSYAQLESLGLQLLRLVGGHTGTTIAVVTEDRIAQASLGAAGLMAGLVVCPLNPAATHLVLRVVLDHAEPALLLVDDVSARVFEPLHSRCLPIASVLGTQIGPTAPRLPNDGRGGLLVYTSGTTGNPKGVLLNELHIGANVGFAIRHFGYDDTWRTASILPLFHTFTIMSDVLPMLGCGGTAVITPGVSAAHIQTTARLMSEFAVQSYSGVPIVFDTLMALRVSLPSSLRFAVAGAAPLTDRTQQRYLERYGHPIVPCYGLTESTCFAAASNPAEIRAGSVGRPAGIEIAVVDATGTPLRPGVKGEIALRGASVISTGYYRDHGKHASAFTPAGWFLTGDIGCLDADGLLRITGRSKNMIIRGGEKIYLEDVDRCLASHEAIADSCTVRMATGAHQERAVAFIVWRNAAVASDEICAYVSRELGPLSRPDDVVSVDTIPRSPSGKAQRQALLDTYEAPR